MGQAFIIMQIGDQELDGVCNLAIVPALKACGLDPKRVDKHNKGGLLKSEIISFIESSDIIVADLTNERPNCYLEVGYAMGVDKFRNLILTAREDHNLDNSKHKPGDPKVHFDLSGYDVLFWDLSNLNAFREELEKRIRRRQAILTSAAVPAATPWDQEWLERSRNAAMPGLMEVRKTARPGFMEVHFSLSEPKPSKTQQELLSAAKDSQIETFGWPIGVVLDRRDEYRPRPTTDGIVAEIATEDRLSYDYWTLRRNGDFFLLQSLFEDQGTTGMLFFNTRIVRITEALLYCARLYSRLNIPRPTVVHVGIMHGGLSGRVLSSAGGVRDLRAKSSTKENQVQTGIAVSLASIEANLVQLVKSLTAPLFTIFDFFQLSDTIYAEIVNSFVEGKIT